MDFKGFSLNGAIPGGIFAEQMMLLMTFVMILFG